jgi:small-conductance mechanosensitive channel
MKISTLTLATLITAVTATTGGTVRAADDANVSAETLELCVETQHELDGLQGELDTGQQRLDLRRADIDEGEARLLEIKAVVEDPDADVSSEERAALVREFNAINANRSAQVPAYQEERDHVGTLIDQYNALTDSYNQQCGDIGYVVEDLVEICARRPELGGTRWCARVP